MAARSPAHASSTASLPVRAHSRPVWLGNSHVASRLLCAERGPFAHVEHGSWIEVNDGAWTSFAVPFGVLEDNEAH